MSSTHPAPIEGDPPLIDDTAAELDPAPISAAARRGRWAPDPPPPPLAVVIDLYDGHDLRLSWSPTSHAFDVVVADVRSTIPCPTARDLARVILEQLERNQSAVLDTLPGGDRRSST